MWRLQVVIFIKCWIYASMHECIVGLATTGQRSKYMCYKS